MFEVPHKQAFFFGNSNGMKSRGTIHMELFILCPVPPHTHEYRNKEGLHKMLSLISYVRPRRDADHPPLLMPGVKKQ
jgi:hypothetical protein